MTIQLNGKTFDLQSNSKVLDFLNENGFENLDGCAVALNDAVVPKSELNKTTLNNADKLLIITATQGG